MTRWQVRPARSLVQHPSPRPGPSPCGPDPRPLRVRGEIQCGHQSGRDSTTASFLPPGAGGQHLPPGVTGADGGRPDAATRPGRRGGNGAGRAPGAERLVRGLAAPSGPVGARSNRPRFGRPPSPRPRRKGRLTCSAASDSAVGVPGSGDPRAERITATAARRRRQRSRGFPAAASQ